MKEKIEKIIEIMDAKHLNDPTRVDGLDEIEEFLSQDLDETMTVLDELSEHTIFWISTLFENISWKFKNPKLIKALEGLVEKFPNLKNLEVDVDLAKEALK